MEECNKREKTSKILSWISLILSIIPYLIFLIVIIDLYMPSDEGHYAWVYILLYFAYAGLPVAVSSLILQIIGNKINKNYVALISLCLNILPLVLSLLSVLIMIF